MVQALSSNAHLAAPSLAVRAQGVEHGCSALGNLSRAYERFPRSVGLSVCELTQDLPVLHTFISGRLPAAQHRDEVRLEPTINRVLNHLAHLLRASSAAASGGN